MRDEAIHLAALGVSSGRVGKTLGFAKSALRKRLNQEEYKRPKLSGEIFELDAVWTRVAGGNALRWYIKALGKGLTHLRTGGRDAARHHCWSGSSVRCGRVSGWVLYGQVHNLLILLQLRGFLA